jgi:hypothetical protein
MRIDQGHGLSPHGADVAPSVPFDPFGLRTAITTHPWRSLAAVFAAGVCFGLVEPRRRFARRVAETLATFAIAMARDAVVGGLRPPARA